MSKIKGLPHSKDSSDRKKYLSRISKSLYYGKLPQYDSLSLPLTELSIDLFSKIKKGKSVDRLHYNDAVTISYNACISPCSLILAMLYIDKLKENNPDYLERTPTADLFLVSLMVSSKFLFDDGESDEVFIDSWATSGGLTTAELVLLERQFLKAIDWRIFASDKTFWKKLEEVEEKLAKIQGEARGHFTYTELEKLLKIGELCDILRCVISVSAILAATYTVGIFTILGSVYLASNVPGTSLYASKIEINKNDAVPIGFDNFLAYFAEKSNKSSENNGCFVGNCTETELWEYDVPAPSYRFTHTSTMAMMNNNYPIYTIFETGNELQGGHFMKTKFDEPLMSLWYKTIKL